MNVKPLKIDGFEYSILVLHGIKEGLTELRNSMLISHNFEHALLLTHTIANINYLITLLK